MTPAATPTRADRLHKILALLDSDQPGEARAAARALKRILHRSAPEPRPTARSQPAAFPTDAEACLTYATDAVAVLTAEIGRLRAENAGLRILLAAGSARRSGRGPRRSH